MNTDNSNSNTNQPSNADDAIVNLVLELDQQHGSILIPHLFGCWEKLQSTSTIENSSDCSMLKTEKIMNRIEAMPVLEAIERYCDEKHETLLQDLGMAGNLQEILQEVAKTSVMTGNFNGNMTSMPAYFDRDDFPIFLHDVSDVLRIPLFDCACYLLDGLEKELAERGNGSESDDSDGEEQENQQQQQQQQQEEEEGKDLVQPTVASTSAVSTDKAIKEEPRQPQSHRTGKSSIRSSIRASRKTRTRSILILTSRYRQMQSDWSAGNSITSSTDRGVDHNGDGQSTTADIAKFMMNSRSENGVFGPEPVMEEDDVADFERYRQTVLRESHVSRIRRQLCMMGTTSLDEDMAPLQLTNDSVVSGAGPNGSNGLDCDENDGGEGNSDNDNNDDNDVDDSCGQVTPRGRFFRWIRWRKQAKEGVENPDMFLTC